ncbi:hypothetical protein ACPRNU_08335 [Chromobacterium vaccinii]|uniref:hypothetical protein n=1 Tax=Chromobacterium vaccinii TaxID=1108595 RepID=UPI003C70A398
MSPPKSSIENVSKLRQADLAPAAVGAFRPAAGLDAGDDKSLGLRGANSLQAPTEGSFSKYLAATIKAELQTAGLLDEKAGTVISGELLENALDPAVETGQAQLAARVVVMRDGAVRFDRRVEAKSQWESSFLGAVAIPLAASQYEALYRKLVGNLLADEDFRKALAKN